MNRFKVTVPAAGQKVRVNATGYSVIVESMPVYDKPEDVPLINFQGSREAPLYPRSVYSNDGEQYGFIEVTGTAASAGDTLYLLASESCKDDEVNILFNQTVRATLKNTFVIGATDVPRFFADLEMIDDSGAYPARMYIASQGGNNPGIRYSFGEDASATQGYLLGDTVIIVEGINFIKAFNFVTATATESGVQIVVTFEYEK